MDLKIKDQYFLVGGATKGFGGAVSRSLVNEGAKVIGVARNEEDLFSMHRELGDNFMMVPGDLTDHSFLSKLLDMPECQTLAGALINAGGPPAMSSMETTIEDWDAAYKKVIRWKIIITKALINNMQKHKYGRLLYVESVSVKQPVKNLVLSNSMRLGMVGYVKTTAQEVASMGITMNILAPGYHGTAAMERLFVNKSKNEGISIDQARQSFEKEIDVGFMGDPADFASLCTWLLSPHSKYLTGQTISVDGGIVKGAMG